MLADADGSVYGCAQHAYSDDFFYTRHSSGNRELVRLCLSTLETETVLKRPADHPGYREFGAMSPDSRFYVNLVQRGETWEVMVADLQTGRESAVASAPDLFNPHPRFDRVQGEWLLIQHNRGQRWSGEGEIEVLDDRLGATVFLVRRDGTGRRDLPISRPFIASSISGHEAWIKGQMAFLVSLRFTDEPYHDGARTGNLVMCRIGEDRPRVATHAPDKYFGHVSTSACGRYWVCDMWGREAGAWRKTPDIVVGSLASGNHAVLCSVGGNWPKYEAGHAHPYMTADAQRVIFGSTRTGTAQVYAAAIPPGFLEALK